MSVTNCIAFRYITTLLYILLLGPFYEHFDITDPGVDYESCLYDACVDGEPCVHLENYAKKLAEEGIVVYGWREKLDNDTCGEYTSTSLLHPSNTSIATLIYEHYE